MAVSEPPIPLELDSDIATDEVYFIVNEVRNETYLPYELSCRAVYVVLEHAVALLPKVAAKSTNTILSMLQSPLVVSNSVLDITRDMNSLKRVSISLKKMKNDVEQRSWELYEDQEFIQEALKEINTLVKDADIQIVKRFLSIDDYEIITTLAEYYQMETRICIRKILLKVFCSFSSIDTTVIKILINSVLPLEIARDMENSVSDVEKLEFSAIVLTRIFSTAEPMPIQCLDYIGKEFILFLLNSIENLPSENPDSDVSKTLVTFVLVYNLQFRNNLHDNIIISALTEFSNPKIFIQTVLFLFNRGEDPLKIYQYNPAPPNCVLKMMTDLFSTPLVAKVFYENDFKVVTDIIIRQLNNMSPENEERLDWLGIVQMILRNYDPGVYNDYLPRLKICLKDILKEDSDFDTKDKVIIRQILGEFKSRFEQ